MGEPASEIDENQRALAARVDDILSAHGGDARRRSRCCCSSATRGRGRSLGLCAASCPAAGWPAMADERRPLSPWAILDRLERRVAARREVRLTWRRPSLVEALRAYVANPKRDELARVICMRSRMTRKPCEPLCAMPPISATS